MQITKRNCKSLTDIRTLIAMDKSAKYDSKKIPNRYNTLKRIFESDYSWQERIAWLHRIIDFKGQRGESIEYQTILHNSYEKSNQLRKEKINRASGENNPAYNHGGRLSPFSDKFIGKSSKEKTLKKLKETIKKNPHKQNTKIEYYLNMGYNMDDAKNLLKERQAVGKLENFIKRYGEKEGTIKWKQRQGKWQKTLNSKPIEELALINSKKCCKGYAISKGEKDLYRILKEHFNELKKGHIIFYNENKNYYAYDIVLKDKIIEYNGDFWHANPKVYNESFVNSVSKKTFCEIWEKEHHKEKVAIDNGYKLLRVWEYDYNQNKDKVIKECIDFLMN